LKQAKKPQRRWRRRKQARPGEIAAAALDLFTERGFAATRLDDVAHRAGVTKGTVYLYFRNKDALFRAAVRVFVLPELERAEEQVAHFKGDTRDLVRQLVHRWWDTVGETHLCGVPKLVVAEAKNFPDLGRFFVNKVVRRGRKLFAAVIKRGVGRGEFKPCDVNHAARVLIAPLVFAAIWERSLRPYDRDSYDVRRYLDLHIDTFLNGLVKQRVRR
jgi:AcrR family transcriptional regulator